MLIYVGELVFLSRMAATAAQIARGSGDFPASRHAEYPNICENLPQALLAVIRSRSSGGRRYSLPHSGKHPLHFHDLNDILQHLADLQHVDGLMNEKVNPFLVGHFLHVLIMRLRDHDKMADGAARHGSFHNAYSIGVRKQQINQYNVGLVE